MIEIKEILIARDSISPVDADILISGAQNALNLAITEGRPQDLEEILYDWFALKKEVLPHAKS